MKPTTTKNSRPLWPRVKAVADVRTVTLLLLILAVMAPGPAAAQSNDFGKLGSDLWGLVCKFINSPIIAVLVGVGILVAFVVAALNEDNGTLSKVLKTVVFGMAILFIPMLLNMIGFNVGNC